MDTRMSSQGVPMEIVHCEGRDYIAALLPSLKGIRIARLRWDERP